MKKVFKYYFVIWISVLVLFNIIAFLSVGWEGQEKYTTSFWLGYIFITVSLLGQLICGYVAFKENNINKMFYNISLVATSYAGLLITFAVGGLCMLISALPYWVGIIICAAVFTVDFIALFKAELTVDVAAGVDDKIKLSTEFIKGLTADFERIISRAQSEAIRLKCKTVYEAVRYSDPVSNASVYSIESEIKYKVLKFAENVNTDNQEEVDRIAKEIIVLLGDRNEKCRLSKSNG